MGGTATITIRGTSAEIDQFLRTIEYVDGVTFSVATAGEPVRESEGAFGQFELVDVVLQFATSVGAELGVALIAKAFNDFRQKRSHMKLLSSEPAIDTPLDEDAEPGAS